MSLTGNEGVSLQARPSGHGQCEGKGGGGGDGEQHINEHDDGCEMEGALIDERHF